MRSFILDSSAILAAFEPASKHKESARALLSSRGTRLATLDFARYEMVNVSVSRWESPQLAAELLDTLEQLSEDGGVIASTNALVAHAGRIAVEESLSVYDAAYVAATRRGDLRLVSCDIRDLVARGLAMTPAEALAESRN
jgi:predicted nucleic acid-binding protein